MTPELLREVFHVEADIVAVPRSGLPLCIPHGLCYFADGASEGRTRQVNLNKVEDNLWPE
jgi:hypothetical protein